MLIKAFTGLSITGNRCMIYPLYRTRIPVLLSFLFFFFHTNAQNPIPPIGEWRDHLNYQHTLQVIMGDKLYCATQTGLFSVDTSDAMERFNKVTGLNEVNVRCIGWDAATEQLVIAYDNSNVDVLKAGKVTNISDIKRSTVSGDKSVNAIFCKDGLAYLSTGLGVIVLNLDKYEVKDTWLIGNNGVQTRVNSFTVNDTAYFAATSEGFKSLPQNIPDPGNYAGWHLLSGTNGLSNGGVNQVVRFQDMLLIQKNDSILVANLTGFRVFYTAPGWSILNMHASVNSLEICEHNTNGEARVLLLDNQGQLTRTLEQAGVISLPGSALTLGQTSWVADQFGGLSRWGTGVDRFIPNGPPGTADGEFSIQQHALYAAAGSVNIAWNYQYNRNGVYQFKDDQWSYMGYFNQPVLDSVLDFITVAIDPADQSLWAGSYGGGLVHFSEHTTPIIYSTYNSSLQGATGDPGSTRVSGLAFDHDHNLWISNYGAPQDLVVRKRDGSWKAFSIPFPHLENAVSQLLVDDENQIWIVSPKDNGLFCYNYGASIDQVQDDRWKFYKQGAGNGNLPGNTVLCIAKDKSGFIWVGTDMGIGIIQCTQQVFDAQGCEATLPIVQQDRFAGLLFKDENVQCIAVDGADRKWVGTKNGVWLLSPDGSTLIYRFTAENSPLLANDVKRIAIDPDTGEIFFATLSGICSFRGTATEGKTVNENVLVFPNPVPPGYQGTIAIRGLTENALVKIAELNGRLVYQTRALGGQAIWNGRNYKGEKIASGVYLVLVRDDSGTEKLVTKIVLTSGR